YIKIAEVDHKGLVFTSKDYELHLLKDRAQWNDVTDYERAMLDRIFQGGQTACISEMKNHFYTVLPMVKSEIMGALKQKGMYTLDPDAAHGYLGIGAVLVAAPYVLMQWSGIADFLNSTLLAVVSGLVAVVIIVLFGRKLSATSLKGARTRVEIQGFQEFMNR